MTGEWLDRWLEQRAAPRALPLAPWAPGVRDQFVTVTTELVDGQRIG